MEYRIIICDLCGHSRKLVSTVNNLAICQKCSNLLLTLVKKYRCTNQFNFWGIEMWIPTNYYSLAVAGGEFRPVVRAIKRFIRKELPKEFNPRNVEPLDKLRLSNTDMFAIPIAGKF